MAVRDDAIAELVTHLKLLNAEHRADVSRVAGWDQAVASMRSFMGDHGINVDDPESLRTLIVALIAVQTAADVAYEAGHMGADSAYGAQWACTHVMSVLAEFAA